MASKAFSQNAFLTSESKDSEARKDANGVKYKKANVYDAVAGKISSGGYISRHRAYASTRDTASSSITPIPPENVLFKRHDAPVRYAESDVYFANEKQSRADLPDSDLLKVLHCYVSEFYSRALADASSDFKSMDETALLAFGILMEEAMKETLGCTGDLTFTEGEEIEGLSPNVSQRRSDPHGKRPAKKPRLKK